MVLPQANFIAQYVFGRKIFYILFMEEHVINKYVFHTRKINCPITTKNYIIVNFITHILYCNKVKIRNASRP